MEVGMQFTDKFAKESAERHIGQSHVPEEFARADQAAKGTLLGISRKLLSSTLLILSTFVFLVVSPVRLTAQVSTGDLVGTITDATGAVIAGAAVKIENLGTHEVRTFATRPDGQYAVTALQPGTYQLTVSAPGFKTFQASDIKLVGGDRARIDAPLTAGAATEEIQVTAEVSALQTDTTNVGSTLTEAAVQDVPLNGRNFMALVQVAPGVNPGSPSSIAGPGRLNDRRLSSAMSANGQDEESNNQMIDGLDNQTRWNENIALRPSVDAIQQVRTDINLYTAEVGRTAGAVVNVLTKSGTNDFHGTAYEFFRNDTTDARNFFAYSSLLPHKPELRQNQFGGSFGGPIRKNRTFFFVDFEEFRKIDGNASVYISSVPSQFEHDNPGNLTDICGPNLSATADPTALAYFKLYPAPTPSFGSQAACTGGVATVPHTNFIYDPSAVQYSKQGDAKIDHHFSQNDTLFGRYSYNHTDTMTPPAFPAGPGGVQNSGFVAAPAPGNSSIGVHQGQLNYTHIFSPRLVMELTTGVTYYDINAVPFNSGKNLNNTAPYLIPNANGCLDCSGLALITLQGSYAPMGDPTFQPLLISELNHQYSGKFTWTLGKHTIEGGGGLIYRSTSAIQGTYPRGEVLFTGTVVNALTSFFKGTGYQWNRLTTLTKPYLRSSESSAFIQDDWRMMPKLTLNLGVRYDVFSPANEKYGNLANFNLTSMTMIQSQTAGIQTSYIDVAPRFGFAYSATPKLVVRGGAGLTFYPGDIQRDYFIANPPYQYSSGLVSSTGQLSITGIAPVVPQSIATSALAGTISTKPFNFLQEYFEQFNLLMQYDLHGTVMTAGYVGQLGRHMENTEPNIELPPPAGPSAAGTPPPALLYASSLPNVNAIQSSGDNGTSVYHSLQLTAERRLSKGLTMNFNYTLAHGLNNVLNTTDGDVGTGLVPSNPRYDYGNSALDMRDRVAGTFTYQFPLGTSGSSLYRAIASRWQVNGLGFWQTGGPLSVIASSTQNGRAQINLVGITADRPNYVASAGAYSASKTISTWLNPAAFVKQPLGTAGNEGRNQFRGPHLRRGDLSLIKDVPIHEQLAAQFRVECFNISNTPNFSNPNATIAAYSATPDTNGNYEATSAGGFGTITTTATGYSGRQLQFALKLQF